MPNASRRPTSHDRPPSRIPRRGAAALLATTAGVALLLSFRTPDALPTLAVGGIALGGLDTAAIDATPTPRPVALADGPMPAATQDPLTTAPSSAPAPRATPELTPLVTPEPTPAPTPVPTATDATQVIDGRVINTRFGPVQVEVTITGGRIVDVQALQLPYDRRYSAEISDYVAPYLRQMALQAQSANIDLISGATYTSDGYARSLQSALKKANP
jgi:uncharacterized protein with FMN-binding domain